MKKYFSYIILAISIYISYILSKSLSKLIVVDVNTNYYQIVFWGLYFFCLYLFYFLYKIFNINYIHKKIDILLMLFIFIIFTICLIIYKLISGANAKYYISAFVLFLSSILVYVLYNKIEKK